MTSKGFAALAIENGHGSGLCDGWDWIRENLSLLDDVFQSIEYKNKDKFKSGCMPLLIRGEDLTKEEENALGTAWYLNNDREYEKEKAEHKEQMEKAGYVLLTEDVVKKAASEKKRLEVAAKQSCDWMTQKTTKIYKPFVDRKGVCWLMNPKARSKGYYLHQFENAFCKMI